MYFPYKSKNDLGNESEAASPADPADSSAGNQHGRRSKVKTLGFLLGFIAVVVTISVVATVYQQEILTVPYNAIKDAGSIGALLYALVFTSWIVVLLPSTPLELLSGYMFGFGWGYLVNVLSGVLGQFACFFIARYGKCARRRMEHFRMFQGLEVALREHPWRVWSLISLAYIPAGIKSYGAGITTSKFHVYGVVTALNVAAFSIMSAYIGSSASTLVALAGDDDRAWEASDTVRVVIMCFGVAISIIVLGVVRWYSKRVSARLLDMAGDIELESQEQNSEPQDSIARTPITVRLRATSVAISNRVKDQFKREWKLVPRELPIIVAGILMQYVHSVMTNVVYYFHRPGARLVDAGFGLLPELAPAYQGLGEILFGLMFGALICFMFTSFRRSQDGRAPYYLVPIISRGIAVISLCQILRSATFLSTILPGSADHCQPGSVEYNPPKTALDIFWRMDATKGCGDLNFSSHTLITLTSALTINHYARSRVFKGLVWLLAVALSVSVIAARHHYTADVVVAWYTVPMVWYIYAQKRKDPQHPTLRKTSISCSYDRVVDSMAGADVALSVLNPRS